MRESTVRDYARRGVLPSIELGRHRRFVRTDVVSAVEQLRRPAWTRRIWLVVALAGALP
jgi:excisionase family DNA binding protein